MKSVSILFDGDVTLRNIENEHDRVLLAEAILALQGGALRAAYVMTWLACAESIKRRLNECAVWDKEAESILSQISGLENNQRAIDGKLLGFAKTLSMIDDIEAGQLEAVYKNRNIYGHPYSTAPTEAEVVSAIELVASAVLTKPLRYKHKFIKELQADLFSKKSFLDDTDGAVDEYVNGFVLKRVDPRVYKILVGRCWKELEQLHGDRAKLLFFRRGVRFCRTLIINGDMFSQWDDDEWHQMLNRYPNALHAVCFDERIVCRFNERAANSWLTFSLEQAEIHPEEYGFLFRMKSASVLSERHVELLCEGIRACQGSSLLRTGLTLKELFPILRPKLTIYDFSKLGDVFDFMFLSKLDEVEELISEDQEYLGACLVSGVQRGAYALKWIFNSICGGSRCVSVAVMRGIISRLFIESNGDLYIKEGLCKQVLPRMGAYDPVSAGDIDDSVAQKILAATEQRSSIEQMQAAAEMVGQCVGCARIAEALKTQSHNASWTF